MIQTKPAHKGEVYSSTDYWWNNRDKARSLGLKFATTSDGMVYHIDNENQSLGPFKDLPDKPFILDKPRSKKDVFNSSGRRFEAVEQFAEKQGLKYCTNAKGYIYKVGWGLPCVQNHLGKYYDLPDTHEENEMSVQEKALEFILSPNRSEPNRLMKILTDSNFFGVSDETAKAKILNDILDNPPTGICSDGVKRFREHMGDLLPKNKDWFVTIEISGLDVHGAPGSVAVANDVKNALNERYTGRTWRNVKVHGVKVEER